ncbi:hypothetical protein ACSOQX_003929 [Yersinia enterocolitica]|nr:hypothetical protein [Yersinia enterocolitica]EKN5104360.1 hypothetical protein [Yersinia enterocolitica]
MKKKIIAMTSLAAILTGMLGVSQSAMASGTGSNVTFQADVVKTTCNVTNGNLPVANGTATYNMGSFLASDIAGALTDTINAGNYHLVTGGNSAAVMLEISGCTGEAIGSGNENIDLLATGNAAYGDPVKGTLFGDNALNRGYGFTMKYAISGQPSTGNTAASNGSITQSAGNIPLITVATPPATTSPADIDLLVAITPQVAGFTTTDTDVVKGRLSVPVMFSVVQN